jgi:hypothetical protein
LLSGIVQSLLKDVYARLETVSLSFFKLSSNPPNSAADGDHEWDNDVRSADHNR